MGYEDYIDSEMGKSLKGMRRRRMGQSPDDTYTQPTPPSQSKFKAGTATIPPGMMSSGMGPGRQITPTPSSPQPPSDKPAKVTGPQVTNVTVTGPITRPGDYGRPGMPTIPPPGPTGPGAYPPGVEWGGGGGEDGGVPPPPPLPTTDDTGAGAGNSSGGGGGGGDEGDLSDYGFDQGTGEEPPQPSGGGEEKPPTEQGEEAPWWDIEKKKSKCFIATAAYGTPLAREIDILRHWRDTELAEKAPGRAFVRGYYLVSPPIAHVIEASETLKRAVRRFLNILVRYMSRPVK